MKIIFIYGAPGVGKLTVGTELSKQTGFKLLHNHLFNDFAAAVFGWGTPNFSKTVHAYRLDLLGRAAKAGVKGVIMTYVYAKHADDPIVQRIVDKAKAVKAKILFVHLTCDKKTLLKRIKAPSRKKFRKLKDTKTLLGLMKRYNLFSVVPYHENMTVDTGRMSARRAAKRIQKHYRL